MIRYWSGENVCVGDVVKLLPDENLQRVSMVIEPRSYDSENLYCEEKGGVLVEPSRTLVTPDVDWEDLVFVSRGGDPGVR